MDSFFVKALGLELQSAITGARIGKPWLEAPYHIIFPLMTRGGSRVYLYYSCHPAFPVLYLMEERPFGKEKERNKARGQQNDQVQVLIQKYLTGSVIAEIQVINMERILIFRLHLDNSQRDFSGEHAEINLIFEIMGRNANVILTSDQGLILAALRYVPAYKNRYRQILPGHAYRFPPKPAKVDPLSLTEESFSQLLEAYDGTASWPNFLQQKIAGLDLLMAGEICQRAESKDKLSDHKRALWMAFSEILDIYRKGTFSPGILYLEDGTMRLFSFPLEQQLRRQLPDRIFENASQAARQFGKIQHEKNAVQELRDHLTQRIHLALDKAKARQSALEEDLSRAEQADQYRKQGDIIMAYVHQIKKGMDHLEARDLFDPQQKASITIPLDPLLTPAQNAQGYYKKYTKARKSLEIIRQRLVDVQKEVLLLSSWQSRVAAESSLAVLQELRDALQEEGIIQSEEQRNPSPQKPSEKLSFKDIRRYVSVDGLEILVGKNDRGNDALTCKIARKDDLWFHAQDAAGSHVLVRNPDRLPQIPYPTIVQAASLAAFFSKARNDTKAAVAYAFKKYVSKPKGAKPGLVVMTQKTSILVSPDIRDLQ
ncbi:MAG: NFACT RNA binding domain-containing protein [bacterium]